MLTDREAIATWERGEAPDPSEHAVAQPYRCTACDWTGRGETALKHYRATGHAIRGRNWPAGWPDCQWSKEVLVAVCSWCPDAQERTAALKRQGRTVTHTICDDHRAEFEAGR